MRLIDVVKTLPRHPTKKYALRAANFLKGIVIHHTATPPTLSPSTIAAYHVEHHGWPGIGYHYVIVPDGTVYKCNNVSTLSYHCKGFNKESIGVCLVGNFEDADPTTLQLTALRELVTVLRNVYGPKMYVVGHKQKTATACPGRRLYLNLPVLFPSQ